MKKSQSAVNQLVATFILINGDGLGDGYFVIIQYLEMFSEKILILEILGFYEYGRDLKCSTDCVDAQ
ncbi:hypothetical protein [Spirosoma sp. KNUC1025]|uniref:hypothetical protein n=1 Tax=Spirosoma sp. KNUC1025 TaxID=2894082 RepID=UPI003870A3B3|nr:hypothetical protein LN737_05060 [Spirosoma sp. KNUC1025]